MKDSLIWKRYKKAKEYQNTHGIVTNTEKNWKMYLGDQWHKLQNNNYPCLNFIEPTVNYKVSTICKKSMTAQYTDPEGSAEHNKIYAKLNRDFALNWERGNLDNKSWHVLKSAAIAGDGYIYWGTDDLAKTQVLPNTAILFGDEMQPEIQKQPYLMIRERLFVENIKKAAEENGVPREEWESLTGDDETEYLTGNKKDLEYDGADGKITSVLYFEKRDGVVWCGRAVEGCEYEPLHIMSPTQNENSVRGLKLYPIVNIIWQEIPNSARGQGEVKKLSPNQIEVNKIIARRVEASKIYSYPRLAYDATAIKNPDALSKVGVAIGVQGNGTQSIQQLISYLQPATMSPDAKALTDDLMETSRSLAGAGDTSMGQIDPTRVSGAAIVAIQDQAALALNEQVAKYKKYVEDIARLWIELLIAYNPEGIEIRTEISPEESITDEPQYKTEILKAEEIAELQPDIKIDVSENTQWSKNDEQTADDNLLQAQHISFEEYVDLIPDGGVLQKNKLRKLLDERKLKEEEQIEGESEDQIEEERRLEDQIEPRQ